PARVLGEEFATSLDWGLLKPWRWAAGLALTALISATAMMAVQAAYLEDRAERYDAAQAEAFRTLFPDARIVNVTAQMRQALIPYAAAQRARLVFCRWRPLWPRLFAKWTMCGWTRCGLTPAAASCR
ncbi:MAG: hypothetical protein JKP95_02735, partial [Oceanicaulis sp.]|nr:hypothetical protein [Oceanicaulis sp.]